MSDCVVGTGAGRTSLGEFLRGRRGALAPGRAGLAVEGLRRVPGLRREEVAVLAGVSADYYTRLEQGREQRPSPEVLNAISRALQLDPDERAHLFRLAEGSTVGNGLPATEVSSTLRGLLDRLADSPALVLGHDLDVLARNELAERLYAGFAVRDNSARMCFLDPVGREFYRDWADVAAGVVGNLRFALGLWPTSKPLLDLIEELRTRSDEFESIWATQGVWVKRTTTKRFLHPGVGELELDYQSFDVRGAEGQQLAVFTAPPGSDSAGRLIELQG